jgi:hypothetical protein
MLGVNPLREAKNSTDLPKEQADSRLGLYE